MKSLIFDLETTGKAAFDSSVKAKKQPHIVEIAMEIYCSKRKEVMTSYSTIVRPADKVMIPAEVTKIHGISNAMVQKYGIPEKVVAAIFFHHMITVDRIVCHNVKFDHFVMQAAFHRFGRDAKELLKMPTFCTMEAATPICKIPKAGRGRGFKWPKLTEAYEQLVDKAGFEGAHSAAGDVAATRLLMIKLDKIQGEK